MIHSRKIGSKIHGKLNLTRGLKAIKADWDDAVAGAFAPAGLAA